MFNPIAETRRHFFGRSATGIGIAALSSLLSPDLASAEPVIPGFPNFPPTAKRVIYLFQHGAPSQLDLFDYKPGLENSAAPTCLNPSAWASASPA